MYTYDVHTYEYINTWMCVNLEVARNSISTLSERDTHMVLPCSAADESQDGQKVDLHMETWEKNDEKKTMTGCMG